MDNSDEGNGNKEEEEEVEENLWKWNKIGERTLTEIKLVYYYIRTK